MLVWAIVGMVPAVMFVTGALMWWNRVLRRRRVAAPAGEEAAERVATPPAEVELTGR